MGREIVRILLEKYSMRKLKNRFSNRIFSSTLFLMFWECRVVVRIVSYVSFEFSVMV